MVSPDRLKDEKMLLCVYLFIILTGISILSRIYINYSNRNDFRLQYIAEYGEYIVPVIVGSNKIWVVPDTGSHELLLHNKTYIECNEVCIKKKGHNLGTYDSSGINTNKTHKLIFGSQENEIVWFYDIVDFGKKQGLCKVAVSKKNNKTSVNVMGLQNIDMYNSLGLKYECSWIKNQKLILGYKPSGNYAYFDIIDYNYPLVNAFIEPIGNVKVLFDTGNTFFTVNSAVFHKLKKKNNTIILIGDISINIENKKFLEEGKFLEDRNIIIVGHTLMNELIIHFDFGNKRIGIIK